MEPRYAILRSQSVASFFCFVIVNNKSGYAFAADLIHASSRVLSF